MRTANPAQVIDDVVVVLRLSLVGLRRRAELEPRGEKRELVDAAGQIVGGPLDSRVACGNGVEVVGRVVDMNEAEANVVDQPRREYMRFRDDENAVMNWQRVGKIQICSAGRCAQRSLQSACSEGNILLRVREKESCRD